MTHHADVFTKSVMQQIKSILLAIFFLMHQCVFADEEILDLLVPSVTDSKGSKIDFTDIEDLLADRYFEEAIALSEEMVENNESLKTIKPIAYGKLLTNLAIILTYAGQYEDSLEISEKALAHLESFLPQFSPELLDIILVRSHTLSTMEKLDRARQQLRRAQHITHRNDGVYTVSQLPIIKKLFEISVRTGDYLNADKQKLFTLQVMKKTYGSRSEEILPTLVELGSYYGERAASAGQFGNEQLSHLRQSLFRRSISMYEEAITIIEDKFSNTDPRLIEPLQGIARTRYIQRSNKKSEQAAERALALIVSNPATDTQDKVNAIIRVGDLYTLTADKRASDLYLRAWQLIQENEEFKGKKSQLFGRPERLWPRARTIVYLNKRPTTAEDSDKELFISAQYTVKSNGRVGNVKFLSKNVPNDEVRSLRTHLYETRFRPRIVDGMLVDTPNLVFKQRFIVSERRAPLES